MLKEREALIILEAVKWLLDKDQGSIAMMQKGKLEILKRQLTMRLVQDESDEPAGQIYAGEYGSSE